MYVIYIMQINIFIYRYNNIKHSNIKNDIFRLKIISTKKEKKLSRE